MCLTGVFLQRVYLLANAFAFVEWKDTWQGSSMVKFSRIGQFNSVWMRLLDEFCSLFRFCFRLRFEPFVRSWRSLFTNRRNARSAISRCSGPVTALSIFGLAWYRRRKGDACMNTSLSNFSYLCNAANFICHDDNLSYKFHVKTIHCSRLKVFFLKK